MYFLSVSDHNSSHERSREKPELSPGPRRAKKRHDCATCGRVFSDNAGLKRHLVIHSGKKPFRCFICGRGFTQSGNLKTHMKVHKGRETHVFYMFILLLHVCGTVAAQISFCFFCTVLFKCRLV